MRLEDITYQISRIFRIPSTFLEFPGVITNVIIPFIFFTYLLKNLVLDKLRILPSNVNWGIACVVSFFTLLWISAFGIFIAMGSILYFCYKKISDYISGMKGAILGIIVGIILAILYMNIPNIINTIMSLI